jgi:general secretion pathway protein E
MLATESRGARPLHDRLNRSLANELLKLNMARAGDDLGADPLAEVLLRDALRENATDIHLDPQSDGMRVRFRIDGRLFDTLLLTPAHGVRLVRHFQATSGMDTTPFRPGDARLTVVIDGHPIDLRLAAVPSVCGEKLAIRILDRQRIERRLNDLGLSETSLCAVARWLSNISGMFLVAGPTGSGKTTTLYAVLHELKARDRSVVTIEDPVEYQIDGVTQIQVDGRHGLDFDGGLRTMLRLDPDYLLLGEIRSAPAARAAVESAGRGRVLMSTIHSTDAVGAVTTLRNYGLEDHEIATSLRVVIGQRLVRTLCRQCRGEEPLARADRQWLECIGIEHPADRIWVPVGCEHCGGIGYRGRIGIFEVWRLSEDDVEGILRHEDERALRRIAVEQGHQPLLLDGYAKAREGITSIAELRAITADYLPAGRADRTDRTGGNHEPEAAAAAAPPRVAAMP